jgi:hypothetical protein
MGISSALGSSALLPAGLGFRNAIINGDFRINQRAFSSTTSSGTYGFDRWRISLSGGTVTYSAQTFSLGNGISGYEPINYARVVTTGQSASSSLAIFNQAIESVRTFAGQAVSVSFWARCSTGTPKVAVELAQVFGTGGSPSSSVFSYVGQATLSTSWQRFTFQFNVPSISGKTLGTASDDYLGLNLWTSAGSDFNSRTGSLGIQSATIDFWGVQVEQNYQPTPFEQRPIGVELLLCQRYFWRWVSATNGDIYHSVYQPASTTSYLHLPLPVTMRKDGVLTVSGTWTRINSALSPIAYYASKNWITIYTTNDASIGNTNSSGFYSSASSSTLQVDSEL